MENWLKIIKKSNKKRNQDMLKKSWRLRRSRKMLEEGEKPENGEVKLFKNLST